MDSAAEPPVRGDSNPQAFFTYPWRLVLLLATAVRLWVAWRAPLSADEAYYWVWSRAPAWGYLDHPPMVAAWIRAGCAVAGDTALGVRLLGPIAALLGTLLLARAAEDFAPNRRAWLPASLMFNATLVCNAGAVILTPDTPLLFFWTAALAALGRLQRTRNPSWWLAVGAAAGLALDSKYTAILLGAGVLAWLAISPPARRWWRAWQLWAGGALALALFAPVLSWNAAHGFASFAKQGGRTADWHPDQALRFLAELLGGQIGLATPILAIVLSVGLARAARALWRREPAGSLLACVTLLPAVVFVQHALGGRVQANWPSVIYPGAALAAACLGTAPVRYWRSGAGLGLLVSLLVFIQAAVAPLALPRAMDMTLIRLAGWQDLAGAVFAAQAQAKATFVAADEYGLASELAFRLHGPVAGVEGRWTLFALPEARLAGRTGILVRSTRALGAPAAAPWSDIVPLGIVTRGRGAGAIAETYRLYRVVGGPVPLAAPIPASILAPVPAPVLLPAPRHKIHRLELP